MRRHVPIPVLLLVALGAAFVAGCGGSGETGARETVLVDYDFATPPDSSDVVPRHGDDPGLHWFAAGWARPGPRGAWMLGREAEVLLHLLGRGAVLELAGTTDPRLGRAGQEIAILLNAQELLRFDLPDRWEERSLRIPLPDDVVRAGPNRLVLRAVLDLHGPATDGTPEAPPKAFHLRRLRVTARLDEREQRTWHDLTHPAPPDGGWDLVRLPVATDAGAAAPDSRRDPAALPDVLMVLLDAARPDHFGCYGYGRDTSPEIDRLAADGLVFRQVVANSAYTICSVPSLMTGRSWRDHGMSGRGQSLRRHFVTLPEVLRDAGYRTIAYSASPFAARAVGTAQGFDEFHEVWLHPEHGKGVNLEYPERLLRSRDAADLGPAPVFCYLHLLAPHEPYVPGPAHDLWTDPGYDGDIDGSYDQVIEILRGKRPCAGDDLARLVSLYDGNLHRVDASVGRIVRHWRSLERGRELLVVILADHGEAFGEHGAFTHNTTVYDEMTRIPLIVHPARLVPELAAARGSYLALSDVMPLLLGALGIGPSGGTEWPRRFLEVLRVPAAPRRAVILRTAAPGRQFGIRTRRFLAICDGWSGQELYDLREDPGAHVNLRRQEHELYVSMIGQLRAILEDGAGEAATDEAELSEQDLETLKSLGYL